MPMTNTTAAPMPSDVFTLLETPRKGQMPRNCERTTLLTKIAPMMIAKYSMVVSLFGARYRMRVLSLLNNAIR